MSYGSYRASQKIDAEYSNDAIIMAVMREADDTTLSFLKAKYPDIWKELQARYNAPGGKLEGEN